MYIMSFFTEARPAAHIAKSEDLINWEVLNNGEPVIEFGEGDGKIVRDPFIIRDKGGVYRMFFTDNWRSQSLGYSYSSDLVNWEKPEFLPVASDLPPVQNCWAPECVYDEQNDQYLLFWSSRVLSELESGPRMDRMYYKATKDFVSYSETKVLFAPGYPVIDASIYLHEGRYYMCFKDERGHNGPDTDYKALRTCTADNAAGPYEGISELLTHNLCEGPTIIRKDGKFVVFYDAFRRRYYGAMESDDFVNFTDATDKYAFPKDCKHCTVIEV